MESRKCVASARQMYAGRALKAGDEFEALSDQDVLDLEAAHLAQRAPVEPERTKRAYNRRDLKAQE